MKMEIRIYSLLKICIYLCIKCTEQGQKHEENMIFFIPLKKLSDYFWLESYKSNFLIGHKFFMTKNNQPVKSMSLMVFQKLDWHLFVPSSVFGKWRLFSNCTQETIMKMLILILWHYLNLSGRSLPLMPMRWHCIKQHKRNG